ncbi:MAG: alpha-hydroxy-acid oxidizing protein [Deltaproteobacteria bacterium]|nr:alpha-hydroxy-acid oxidizing protein [Deltaproteobacteria bacterium]
MDLTELYEKGKGTLASQKIGFTLEGVETGWVMENNRRIMDRYVFHQKAIDAPSSANTEVSILGVTLKTPVIMSAMTMPIPAIRENGLALVAEGLKAAGSMMWTGTPIPQNLRELARAGIPLIQNVKPHRDREKIFRELKEIQEAGVTWVGVEIDAGMGTKIRDQQIAKDCCPLSVNELTRIRKAVDRPLVFKGILSVQDALKSLEAGADAMMVSNHGAHTIDYLPHPFQVLEGITEAVKGRIPIFVDCGFRRGSDVLKGLALGARLVGLGRPVLYGLAADGAEGVRDVVLQVTAELARIMVMVGAGNLSGIRRECVMEA